MNLVILLQAVATYFMSGVIWFVQVVHYPLFQAVPDTVRSSFCKKHTHFVSWVVIPAMVIELGTAIITFLYDSGNLLWLIGLILLVGIWTTTFALIVPLHNRLVQDGDLGAAIKIVRRNWLRTGMWSLRGFVLFLLLSKYYMF